MIYEDLLNRGLIKPFAAGKAQSASRLALAKRDIKAACDALKQFVLTVNLDLHITDSLFVIDNRLCV